MELSTKHKNAMLSRLRKGMAFYVAISDCHCAPRIMANIYDSKRHEIQVMKNQDIA